MSGRFLLAGVLSVTMCLGLCAAAGAGQLPAEAPPVGIVHYDVSLAVDFEENSCDVEVICRVRNSGESAVSELPLRLLTTAASGARVEELAGWQQTVEGRWEGAGVTVGEEPSAPWYPDNTVTVIGLSLPRAVSAGGEELIRVSYRLAVADPSRSEMLHELPAERRELILIHDYHWLPIVEAPRRYGRDQFEIRRKPTWTVSVETPQGYRVVAIDGEEVEEGRWRSRVPSYPQVFVGRYRLMTVQESGVVVDVYAPPGVADDRLAEAGRLLGRYYQCYAEEFGALEGERLNVVFTACPGFLAHGGYLGFAAEEERAGERHVLAHELAHSWWGLSVTSYGVGTKFLRESLADWSARWATQTLFGEDRLEGELSETWYQFGLVARLLHLRFEPLREEAGRTWPREAPVINYGIDPEMSDAVQAYRKGPLLVQEIAETVGEEAFLEGLREFATRYEDGYCTLPDFLEVMRESTGHDVADLVRRRAATGLDTSRHSFYVVSGFACRRIGEGWETEVTIVNRGLYETVCPLELRTAAGNVERMFQVPPGEAESFRFTTAEEVSEVVIDPRWEPLEIPGETAWRGMNLPSDDPWEMARRMTPESMGRRNWAWYGQGLGLARAGEWERCREVLTEAIGMVDVPVYRYLRGIACLHLQEREAAAQDLRPLIDELLAAAAGEEMHGAIGPPLWSFKYSGMITDTDETVFVGSMLRLLTGEDFGYVPGGAAEDNAVAVQQWKGWWAEHRDDYQVPQELLAHPEVLPIFTM